MADERVARQRGGRLDRVAVGRRLIGLEDGVGLRAEPIPDVVGETLCRGFLRVQRDAGATLVGVPAGEQRHVRLPAGGTPNIDGYALRENVYTTFAAGRQAHVPLLAGWNGDESRASVTLNPKKPTAESFAEDVRKRFGAQADAVLKAYQPASDADAIESAAALASDTFTGHSTWKWIEMQASTGGGAPVYRYSFDRKIPVPANHTVMGRPATSADVGARHAGEIEYVFGTLASIPNVTWEPSDKALSDSMTSYWANFAKKGDPNGAGLPVWPKDDPKAGRVLHLDVTITDGPETARARYEALDAFVSTWR